MAEKKKESDRIEVIMLTCVSGLGGAYLPSMKYTLKKEIANAWIKAGMAKKA